MPRAVFRSNLRAPVRIHISFNEERSPKVAYYFFFSSCLGPSGKASKLKNAALLISCRYEKTASGSTLPAVHVGKSVPVPSAGPSSSSAPMVDPTQNLNVLEQFILKERDSVQISTPSGIESAGTVINAISPDKFGTVVGFLKRFVQIGDAISEASFYLASNSYHQTKILEGPPICKACLDCADCRAKGFSCPPKHI
jgi:hypothetical protein